MGLRSEKQYDIDLTAGGLSTRIEVYCPGDFFGFQLLMLSVPMLFKYLEVDAGFEVHLELKTSKGNFYAYEIGCVKTVQDWLVGLNKEAAKWVTNACVGDQQKFEGPANGVWLVAKLRNLHESAEVRCVTFIPATRSTDSRLFFEIGKPTDTAKSQWGKKLLSKLNKRQCGHQTQVTFVYSLWTSLCRYRLAGFHLLAENRNTPTPDSGTAPGGDWTAAPP